jgi:riboflavin synthase
VFTGIIQRVGQLRGRVAAGPSATLTVDCPFDRVELGESIAVNGVCLTVVTVERGVFTASASSETLSRTTLGSIDVGARVNLERALTLSDRLGGHIVSGHIDGIGHVLRRENIGTAERVRIAAPKDLMRFVAEKGSITIEGVSLTVNAVMGDAFEVMLVPYTRDATALGDRTVGLPVNLEADVIARYVARWIETRDTAMAPTGITLEFLEKQGFIKS